MFENNRICKLFGIQYPIVQAGMVWCSGWRLAAAVSNAGGLGLIGAGSMTPELLLTHIQKARENTDKPFGVNLPLLGPDVGQKIDIILKENVKIVFTSAGNPKTWTTVLKENRCIVTHVIAGSKYAIKAVEAGTDALVAEGFEAGGHNGREESTTFVLIPAVRKITDLPLIAAGGMYGGGSLLAAIALGADGIQAGSRFAVTEESSAHLEFKKKVIEINEGDTRLSLKKLIPVRMIRNNFYQHITKAEEQGSSRIELLKILGEGRSKLGIFEGDLEEGELEIGQVSALLDKIQPAGEIVKEIIKEYLERKKALSDD
ncbi:MAG: nitronate monooxygenase [Bacteroidales bacterium]|nr:nitronate monooxygenase [Bacteroidales bacterium]